MPRPVDPGSILLSHYQSDALLQAHHRALGELDVSLDLNLTLSRVRLLPEGVEFPEGRGPCSESGAEGQTQPTTKPARVCAEWPSVHKISKSANGCFLLRPESFWKIQIFSPLTDRPYSLMPTAGAPTVLNAGFTMHRIKGVTPEEDTRRKLQALGQLEGRVLDTSTGLGYTAIAAARLGASVVTIELDPAMLKLASYNPWSRELFENPAITRITGDALLVAAMLPPASFTAIIHDPPTMSLAGDLYSRDCYRTLYQLLEPGGRLFHYVGNMSTPQGNRTARLVVRGLRDVGFRQMASQIGAFGITARR